MSDDGRMFADLMKEQPERVQPTAPLAPKAPSKKSASSDDLLPDELESLGAVGYTSHSYRLTESEARWLRRFALRLSERLDIRVTHNTLFRALLRLGDAEWRTNPKSNRLIDLLTKTSD